MGHPFISHHHNLTSTCTFEVQILNIHMCTVCTIGLGGSIMMDDERLFKQSLCALLNIHILVYIINTFLLGPS